MVTPVSAGISSARRSPHRRCACRHVKHKPKRLYAQRADEVRGPEGESEGSTPGEDRRDRRGVDRAGALKRPGSTWRAVAASAGGAPARRLQNISGRFRLTSALLVFTGRMS